MSKAEIEEVLRLLLEIVFEISIDLSKPAKFLIKRQFSLLIYLSILSFLAINYKDWETNVEYHIQFFCSAIDGSYWNYSICSRVLFFVRIDISSSSITITISRITIIEIIIKAFTIFNRINILTQYQQ